MGRPALEVADIFRAHGPAWRQAQHGHLSLGQLKVMSAIEQCRSAALGGHVLRCDACDQVEIAYNSCRNRHCPKCQASAAALARGPAGRPAAVGLLPCGVHPAGADQRHRLLQQGADLRPVVRGCCGDPAHHRRRPEASRRADWRDAGPAYLGVGADAPSACARHRSWWGPIRRRRTMGLLQAGFLPAGARAVAAVPASLPRRTRSSTSRRPAAVLRRVCRARRRAGFRRLARAAAHVRMGRLCQAPVRRPSSGARLSVPVHPSGGDLQPAPARTRRTRRHLPLEGLPRHRARRATRP